MSNVISLNKRKPFRINIISIILLIIFIYVFVSVIMFVTKKKVTIYEVNAGSIQRNSIYTGYVIREEKLVTTAYDGYIDYFISDGKRVAVEENICCIDSSDKIHNYVSDLIENKTTFKTYDINSINNTVSAYKYAYNTSDFSKIYDFKNNLDTVISNCVNENIIDDLNQYIDSSNSSANIIKTDVSGVVYNGYDGFENVKEDELKYTDYAPDNYKYTNNTATESVKSGDFAYRIVTNEEWSIYIKLTDEQAKEYADYKNMYIRFLDSNISTNTDFSIYTNQYGVYGKITLNRYMEKYADTRYVNIEIEGNNLNGLKIPKESVTKKECYKIPIEFVSGDDINADYYINIDKPGKDTINSFEVTVCGKDNEFYYVDMKNIEKNTVIRTYEKQQDTTFTINDTAKIQGVYRINKGYAVFRSIEIIDENDDFYIISKNTVLGINLYDHIVQDGSKVIDEEIFY